MVGARRGARSGAVSGAGLALGSLALLGGLGLLAAGANRRQREQEAPDGLTDLDRELNALGLTRESYDPGIQGEPGGPSLRLEQGSDGILRPVITMDDFAEVMTEEGAAIHARNEQALSGE